MSKFRGGGVDSRDDLMRSLAEVHGFATAIVGCVSARHPPASFQPM
jgi:hypothetical protein